MHGLTRLKIEGFKSIRSAELELRPLNVLIGANGSGKSNLVSFFRLLRAAREDRLQLHVGQAGGATSLLHYGPKVTPGMKSQLVCRTRDSLVMYDLLLAHASQDRLLAHEDAFLLDRDGQPFAHLSFPLGTSVTLRTSDPSVLPDMDHEPELAVADALDILARTGCYHINDTTPEARVHQQCYIHDNRELDGSAGNLSAYLYMLREVHRPYYQRIVDTIRLVAPFFGDFDIEPLELNPNNVMINWRDSTRNHVFGSHQLSDGTLRFIALATLLLQPEERLPKLIVIDEPELGLHPYAISVLAGLLRSASHSTQIIVATQSAALVDEFEPEDIVVVDHHNGESSFRRVDSQELAGWLEDYSVGELWEKNVFGGRPSR